MDSGVVSIFQPRRGDRPYPGLATWGVDCRPFGARDRATPKSILIQTGLASGTGLLQPGEQVGEVERLGEDPVDPPGLVVARLDVDVPAGDQRDLGGGDELAGM